MNLTNSAGRYWAVLALAMVLSAAGSLRAGERAPEQENMVRTSEIEGRRVVLPPDLNMDLDWYSPTVSAESGRIVKGWVKSDLILLATDTNTLIAIRRSDGTEQWRVQLDDVIRYEPVVTRSNVVVNIKNFLVAIEKQIGEIRWRLLPKFVMSNAVVVVDPAAYPRQYSKDWQNLERVYCGTWDGRMHSFVTRGRITTFLHGKDADSSLSAPDFDLYYTWHKTLPRAQGRIMTPVRMYDELLYYAADDHNVYAVSRDAELRDPYTLQAEPATPLTVTSANLYVGARDLNVYALDRLTLKKKWTYPAGNMPWGNIFSDEPTDKTLVYLPTETAGVHAVRVISARGGSAKEPIYIPETYALAWKVADAEGAVGASQNTVYLGKGRTDGFFGYKQVMAVDKDTGKVRWSSNSEGVRFYIEFQNSWRRSDEPLRLYTVTEDNRLVSFKEKTANAGPLVEKKKEESKPDEKKKVPGAAHAEKPAEQPAK